jgi:chromosome segregation ATPase
MMMANIDGKTAYWWYERALAAEARIAELEQYAIDAEHDREDMARQIDERNKRIAELERVIERLTNAKTVTQ